MDSALCQFYRPYLVALRRYMRLTAQKNALLKSYDITPNGNMLLDTYDEQLAEYGALIMEHRCKFPAAAAPIAADAVEASGEPEKAREAEEETETETGKETELVGH